MQGKCSKVTANEDGTISLEITAVVATKEDTKGFFKDDEAPSATMSIDNTNIKFEEGKEYCIHFHEDLPNSHDPKVNASGTDQVLIDEKNTFPVDPNIPAEEKINGAEFR